MSEQIYPNITAVNDKDELVGYFQLFDAIAKGYKRRVSCVFVFDEDGRVLIQRRSSTVLSPNSLDYSAAGHVNEGDDYLATAKAELFEELGIKDVSLELLMPPFLASDFFNAVYKTVIPKETALKTNEAEVAKVFWVTVTELQEMIARHPQQFSGSFLEVWPHIRDKIIV
jgi:isopentenyl-diphosphate Delta-isomerase